MLRALVLCLFATTLGHADGTWQTYSHPDPEFSVDYPSAWTATLAETVADEKWGDLSLRGKAKVSFKVALDLDVLQVSVSVFGPEEDTTDERLLAALKALAKTEGRPEDKVAFEESPGLLRIKEESQKAGRTIVTTHVLDGTDVYCVELSVPDLWIEKCRAGYGYMVDSLLASLLGKSAQPRLPSAEQFATELVAIINATEKMKNAEMVRLFEDGTRLIKEGLAFGHRIHFKLAQQRFREMLDIDRNVGLGHFALGLARFYAWEMGAAQQAFREAISLDPQLEPLCPLLWWEDFEAMPPEDRWSVTDRHAQMHVRLDDVLYYRGEASAWQGLILDLMDKRRPWSAENTSTIVRFRFVGDEPVLQLAARMRGAHQVNLNLARGSAGLFYWPSLEQGTLLTRTTDRLVDPGWHTAELVVTGRSLRGYLDGSLLVRASVPESTSGYGLLSIVQTGETLVDWVLVTRWSE